MPNCFSLHLCLWWSCWIVGCRFYGEESDAAATSCGEEGATQFKRRQMHRWRRIFLHEVARLKLWSRTKGRGQVGDAPSRNPLILLVIGVNNREEVMWGRSWDTRQGEKIPRRARRKEGRLTSTSCSPASVIRMIRVGVCTEINDEEIKKNWASNEYSLIWVKRTDLAWLKLIIFLSSIYLAQ